MFDCQECTFEGVSSENLREHVADKHLFGKIFYFISDKNVPGKSLEETKIPKEKQGRNSVHKNMVRFQCNICDYKAFQRTAITEHFKRKHKTGEELNVITLRCAECENGVPHENCCKQKQRTKNDIKYKCDECSYKTNYLSHLSVHIHDVHKNLVRFQCNICEFKAFVKPAIKKHFLRKHGNGDELNVINLRCEQCENGLLHDDCCMQKKKMKKKT